MGGEAALEHHDGDLVKHLRIREGGECEQVEDGTGVLLRSVLNG